MEPTNKGMDKENMVIHTHRSCFQHIASKSVTRSFSLHSFSEFWIPIPGSCHELVMDAVLAVYELIYVFCL